MTIKTERETIKKKSVCFVCVRERQRGPNYSTYRYYVLTALLSPKMTFAKVGITNMETNVV